MVYGFRWWRTGGYETAEQLCQEIWKRHRCGTRIWEKVISTEDLHVSPV